MGAFFCFLSNLLDSINIVVVLIMKKVLLLSVFLLLFCFSDLYCQSKKEVVKNKIVTRKEIRTDYVSGKPVEYVESEKRWDEKGNIVEEKKFNFQNAVVFHVKYKYNEKNDIILEEYFSSSGSLNKKIEYLYSDGIKVEKCIYAKDNVIKTRKVYQYQFRKDD